MNAGRINGWECRRSLHRPDDPDCGRITYAIHVHDGVTPMFLACRASGHEPDHPDNPCTGIGVSLMYPTAAPPKHVLDAVAWEWYSPDDAERVKLDRGSLEHVLKGGLLLRPLTDAGRELLVTASGAA